jgi:hypothetical protein
VTVSVPGKRPALPPFSSSMQPPKPKPFHMTEPFQDRGLWCFWLTAEEPVLQYVCWLHCILTPPNPTPFHRRAPGRMLFSINPRYDYQEAWLWIYDLLQSETQTVELNAIWDEALGITAEEEDDYGE